MSSFIISFFSAQRTANDVRLELLENKLESLQSNMESLQSNMESHQSNMEHDLQNYGQRIENLENGLWFNAYRYN